MSYGVMIRLRSTATNPGSASSEEPNSDDRAGHRSSGPLMMARCSSDCSMLGLLETDMPMPHCDDIDRAGTCDVYDLILQNELRDLIGRLFELGRRATGLDRHADRQDKPITELRTEFKGPAFPGYMEFIEPLSKLERLPQTWITALQVSRGIYVLTCPRTKEQYVGSATGADGFWGPLARLCGYRPRRQCRPEEPRPERLSGGDPRSCR